MPRRQNPIAAAFEHERAAKGRHTLGDGDPGETPDIWQPRRRHLRSEPAIVRPERIPLSIDEARRLMETVMLDYFSQSNPTHKLLLKMPPGIGKTTTAVTVAEMLASAGKRVAYIANRHDLFVDIQRIADRPSWWYEWQPRRKNDDDPALQTCHYEPQMRQWQERRYPSMAFCAGVCGWSYVHDGCPFHAQKETRAPIVFLQHQHLVAGHPLMETFDCIIGDESPIGVFPIDWVIPARYVVPKDMDPTEPITEILHRLHDLVMSGGTLEGPLVINALGGPDAVREAVAILNLPLDAVASTPHIHRADDVEQIGYFHLPVLADLLDKEAAATKRGADYPPRIVIRGKELHLYRKNAVVELAKHLPTMWLDATANTYLYQKATGWQIEVVEPHVEMQGRIYQVWDSANTKSSFTKDETATAKRERIRQQVDQIIATGGYQRPAVISYQNLGDAVFSDLAFGHFGGNRGTNRYEDADALIIIGTPQPPLDALVTEARQLFPDRWTAFQTDWTDRDVVYDYIDAQGRSWSIPVPGFWNDSDLHAVLWDKREAEIIQSAHRVRPLLYAKDVWLLLNLPIDELPPFRLLTVRDLFGAPEGIDPYRWQDVERIGREKLAERGYVTAADLVDLMGVKRDAANRYIDALTACFPDQFQPIEVKAAGRGRPPKAVGVLPHPIALHRQN